MPIGLVKNMTRSDESGTGQPVEVNSHYQTNFSHGIELFNARRFFDAHEVWEEIWLASPEPRKTFLQGIIQIAAAYHHYLRGNCAGTCSLLKAGLRRMENFPGSYHGIEVELLRVAAREWCYCLGEGQDPGVASLPQIKRGSE